MQRHSDEPFVILGVNTDQDKDMYRKKADEMKVTWRSAWDGSTGGPITKQYRVNSFPSIHVIDAEGRLRFMNVRGPALEKAVEQLLKELEEEGAG